MSDGSAAAVGGGGGGGGGGAAAAEVQRSSAATAAVTRGPLSLPLSVLGGSAASSIATLVSNPFEVLKTRCQLQGELGARGAGSVRYAGVASSLLGIARGEGLRGLYAGFAPAVCYQACMNGARLGSYDVLKHSIGLWLEGGDGAGGGGGGGGPLHSVAVNAVAAGAAGVLGAFVASPFFLVKVRLQSQSKLFLATDRHAYRGLRDAFADVWARGGVRGLWTGAGAAMIRVAVGSVAQLGTYDSAKLAAREYVADGIPVHAVAAFASGLAVTLAMNPFDVVSTRLYNQSVARYRGVADCILQTVRTEGTLALWKGSIAHYWRLGPHTLVSFVVWEQLKLLLHQMSSSEVLVEAVD